MFERTLLLTAAITMMGAGAAEAQDWRSLTSSRQRGTEDRLEVHVRYGAGRLLISPSATGGDLYRIGLRYDSDVFDPVAEYSGGRLEVGVEGTGSAVRLKNSEAGELDLRLSPEILLDLDLKFGAVEADLELGGLRIGAVDIETGASETRVSFSRPNPIPCERLEISMGAAAFRAEGLGNANCAEVAIEGGVGDMTLDFGGEWRRSLEADVSMALGSLTLVVPADVGVQVEKDTFLTGFSRAGFEERDGTMYSRNWETARHRLTVELSGAFGSVNVRWRN